MNDMIERFDAIVVGASFGGLVAAGELAGSGRVLLVDRLAPGAGETSACGTLLAVLEQLDALDALEQIHPRLAINVGDHRITLTPRYPFATFDYATLCQILAARLDGVEVARSPFDGVDPGRVLRVGDRRVEAPVLIDASGWRAVLTRGLGGAVSDRTEMSFGLETRHGHSGCDLEFWLRPPAEPDGVFWAFPAGGHVREGIASYHGQSRGLRDRLGGFTGTDGFPARSIHGGFFPAALREPTPVGIFAVGDAAGQCLPLTGEGIRPALVWGQEAGRQARRVVSGETPLTVALAAYRSQVRARRGEYAALRSLQAAALGLPMPLLRLGVRMMARGPLAAVAQRAYWGAADPDTLTAPGDAATRRRVDAAQCARGPAATENAAAGPQDPSFDHDPSFDPQGVRG